MQGVRTGRPAVSSLPTHTALRQQGKQCSNAERDATTAVRTAPAVLQPREAVSHWRGGVQFVRAGAAAADTGAATTGTAPTASASMKVVRSFFPSTGAALTGTTPIGVALTITTAAGAAACRGRKEQSGGARYRNCHDDAWPPLPHSLGHAGTDSHAVRIHANLAAVGCTQSSSTLVSRPSSFV